MSRAPAKLPDGWAERVAHAAKTYTEDHPGTPLGAALVAAQLSCEVPAELRMTTASLKQYSGHSANLRAAIEAAGLKYPARRPQKALAPLTTVPLLEKYPRQHQKAQVETKEQAPQTQAAAPLLPLVYATQAQLIEQLFKLQREEIIRTVKAEIAERMAEAFAEPVVQGSPGPESTGAEGAAPAPERRRLLIVGLYPAQTLIVRARLTPLAGLRFWTDNGTDKLKAAVGWADHVIVQVKNVSHSTVNLLKQGGKPLHYANGGATDLVAQAQHLLKENANV